MRHSARLRAVFLLAALTMLRPFDRGGGPAAQDTQATRDARTPRIPTFRVSTELIHLDVVVTDSSGTPVGSLVAEDFEIRQDGKPLPVRFAEYVEPSGSRVASSPSGG